ncbi:EamA family transporter [Halioglobus japonicus]|uniref:EamA/RhaT family transporter n=1 Tax=Halioglobus japonicus TaxID=930805 RepID=A0AAP8MGN2_9GAMM|nr:DMT family transporter [Halioglobus japonicus]AQA19410.1 EamA family transporter [Halioglobus japonicus]PLW87536.1 EamA/RhaT family transporter [Halioglobus japonicus]GHD07953.1 membrane protein [Halioglobus japonicus]
MNAALYLSTIFIWGTTWLAIYYQVGEVPVVVSVFYRFVLAAAIMLLAMLVLRKLQKTTRQDHLFFLLQGGCLFSFNFICFYTATESIASGLVSVVFSLATIFNAVNNRLIWKETIPARVVLAGAVGALGLVLLFLPELGGQSMGMRSVKGLLLATVGTYLFSLGNMITRRNGSHGLHPATTNTYSMLYGTVILAVVLLITGQPLVVPKGEFYLPALLYLSIFGTVIGFTTYLMLVNRIGPNHAAYATVLFPVIALFLSSWFEGYNWQLASFVGLGLVLLGNVILIFRKPG